MWTIYVCPGQSVIPLWRKCALGPDTDRDAVYALRLATAITRKVRHLHRYVPTLCTAAVDDHYRARCLMRLVNSVTWL